MAASRGIGILLASTLLAAVILITACLSAGLSIKTTNSFPREALQEKPFLCNLLREAAAIASHRLSKAAMANLPLSSEAAKIDSAVFMYHAIRRASMLSDFLGRSTLKGFKETEASILDPAYFNGNLTNAIKIKGLSCNATAVLIQNHTVLCSNSSAKQIVLPLNGSVNGSLYVFSPFDVLAERTARWSSWGSCEKLYNLSSTDSQWLFVSTSEAYFFNQVVLPRCLELTLSMPKTDVRLLNITLNSSLLEFSQCRGDLGDLRFAVKVEVYEVAITLTNPLDYDLTTEAVLINITDPRLVRLIPEDGSGVRVFSSPKRHPYAVANEIPVWIEKVTNRWAALRVKVPLPSHSSKTLYIYLGDFTKNSVSSIHSVSKILLHENFSHLKGWSWGFSGKKWRHGFSYDYFYFPPASHYIAVSAKKLHRGWYGALSKSFTLSSPCDVVVEARCFEWCSQESYGYALQKQLLVDDAIVWKDLYIGSEGWQQIKKEVHLTPGSHTITLRLYVTKQVKVSSCSPLFWDELLVYSYTPVSVGVHVDSIKLIEERFEWLPTYLDYWNPLSKRAVFLVKLPSIPPNNVTLYLFYGNNTLSRLNDVRRVAVEELYDFEQGAETWFSSGSAWMLENSSPYSGKWCFKGEDFSSSKEFVFKRDISFQGFLEISYYVKFGESDAPHIALAFQKVDGSLIKILQAGKNGKWQSPLLGFRNGIPYEPNKWYHVRISINEHIAAIWVNGELLAEHPIPLIHNSQLINNVKSLGFLPSTKKGKGTIWLDKICIKYLPSDIPRARIVRVRALYSPQTYPINTSSSTLVITSPPSTKIEVIDPHTGQVIASTLFRDSPIVIEQTRLESEITIRTKEVVSPSFLYAYNPSNKKLKAIPLPPQPPILRKISQPWRFFKEGRGCAAYGWYPPDAAIVLFSYDLKGGERTACHLLLLNDYLEGYFKATAYSFQLKHNVIKHARLFLKITAEKSDGNDVSYYYRLAGGKPPSPRFLDKRLPPGEWHSLTVNLTRDAHELGLADLKGIKALEFVLSCDKTYCFAELRNFELQSSLLAIEGVPATKLYVVSNGASSVRVLSSPKLLIDDCSSCRYWLEVEKGCLGLYADFGKSSSEGGTTLKVSHIAKRFANLSGLLLVKVNCSLQRRAASRVLSLQVRVGLKLANNEVFWSEWHTLDEGVPTIVTADFRHLGYIYAKELLLNFRVTGRTTYDAPHVLSARAEIYHVEVFNNQTTYLLEAQTPPQRILVADTISPGDTYLFRDGFLILKGRSPSERAITIKGLPDFLLAIGLKKSRVVAFAQGGSTINLPTDKDLDKLLLVAPSTKPYHGVISPSTVFINRTALLEDLLQINIPSPLRVGEELNLTAKCSYRNQTFLLVHKVRFEDVALELTSQGLFKALTFNATILLSPPPLCIPATSTRVYLIGQDAMNPLPTKELDRGVIKVNLPYNCTRAKLLFLFSDGIMLPVEVCFP